MTDYTQIVAVTDRSESFEGAPKYLLSISHLYFWRGGKIFKPTKKRIRKREVRESLSEKNKQDEIDFPPQFGEATHRTTIVIF